MNTLRTQALAACFVATALIAGAGVAYRAARSSIAPDEVGPDPVVTVLPARAVVPSAGDPVATAQAHLRRARETDDPREESYAEAALAPALATDSPSLPALFLRAVLAQRRHDFPAAIVDLERVLTADPKHPDARLTLAFVQLAAGQSEAAASTCAALAGVAPSYVHDTCTASTEVRLGRGQEALARLRRWTDAADPGLSPPEVAWMISIQAEVGEALGRAETDAWYRRSLTLDPGDRYTRIAYADYLLDQHRPEEVLQLLEPMPVDREPDALLLRRALALRQRGADATPAATALRTRFDAMTQRGDPLHLREEVRFHVAFEPATSPTAVLDLATRNYAIQKEPWDARILLEACVRAGHRTPCNTVLADTARLQHVQIRALRDELATVAP